MPGPRRTPGLRRFSENQYPVNMVRHEDEIVQRHVWEMGGDLIPASRDNFTKAAEVDFIVNHPAEKAPVVPRADRHEVGPFGRVIVPRQPQPAAAWGFEGSQHGRSHR
jgi:hypothetical protein